MDHVNQLDAETAKNTNAIRDVDQRTQAGLKQADAASQAAMDHANQVQQQAQQVNQQLQQTSGRVRALDSSIADLDNYKQTSQATVHFGFDKSNLTPDAQQTLDGVVSQVQQDPHSILEIEGFTDTT